MSTDTEIGRARETESALLLLPYANKEMKTFTFTTHYFPLLPMLITVFSYISIVMQNVSAPAY